jgi:hypothetical protein
MGGEALGYLFAQGEGGCGFRFGGCFVQRV